MELGAPVLEKRSSLDLYAEIVARTVHVANLAVNVTEKDLATIMNACGRVSFVKLAGDSAGGTRFAFVEFETIAAAQQSFKLTGIEVMGHAIRVKPSQTPITDSQARVVQEQAAAQRALEEVQRAKLFQQKKLELEQRAAERTRKSRSRSRSTSRGRDRSNREGRSTSRRDRDRSRERDRDRDRDRDRRGRSRSRERRR